MTVDREKADAYNRYRLNTDNVPPDALTALTAIAQRSLGLEVDGMCGPETLRAISLYNNPRLVVNVPRPLEVVTLADELVIVDGWLTGAGVMRMEIDPSWYYARLTSGTPKAIVWHYTNTDPGTGDVMAKHRQRKIGASDRQASWHITIETDGTVIQMAPLTAGCWHAGSATVKPIPGVGSANRHSTGIELVGYGKSFPEPQVVAGSRVARALVRTYGISVEHAMITHQQLDPTRRNDPGPVWMKDHAPGVIAHAYR